MSRSAAPLGSLRSPRRAAERKSGHFTCYENRTFYLLPTRIGRSLDDLDLKVSYAYAQWHLEAWFFADESGLRGHLGKNLGNVDASQPDRIDNPKLHLRNLLTGRLYTAEMAERMSRNLDATTITAKSTSFARFQDVVRNGRSS